MCHTTLVVLPVVSTETQNHKSVWTRLCPCGRSGRFPATLFLRLPVRSRWHETRYYEQFRQAHAGF